MTSWAWSIVPIAPSATSTRSARAARKDGPLVMGAILPGPPQAPPDLAHHAIPPFRPHGAAGPDPPGRRGGPVPGGSAPARSRSGPLDAKGLTTT
ncbi:hypothetical protein Misp01_33780 [Microtetraspora sp. NBRC 13810]|nr:hypothetical protein Misp01_33780 [Microtetraspora sp. NBRC 13810]